MRALAEIEVRAPGGEPVRIGELVDRPTILIIPRYYGCLPCRDYLRQVADRYDEVEAAGARAIGISVGADFQAAWLIEHYGIPFPLLVDPQRRVHEAIELDRKVSVALNPWGWARNTSAISRGKRQGKIVDPFQLPGLVLLDADARPPDLGDGRRELPRSRRSGHDPVRRRGAARDARPRDRPVPNPERALAQVPRGLRGQAPQGRRALAPTRRGRLR